MNLFREPSVVNNRHQLRNQIISTRLYLLLFPAIIISTILYLSLLHIAIFIRVESPTSTDFSKLYKQHNSTLQCPCTNILIPYEKFVSIEVKFHEICSIDLDELINSSFIYTEKLTNTNDFRFTAALQFRLLTLFCSVINETITNRLIHLMKMNFISSHVLSVDQFENQIDNLIVQLIRNIKNQFINSIQMIRINTYGSQITSGVFSNYKIFGKSIHDQRLFWPNSRILDDNCSCSTSFSCTSSAKIFDNEENMLFQVPGFRTRCFVLESLLVSSLECFYNTSCINELQEYILNSDQNSILLSLPSKFNPTDTIEILLNRLMMEYLRKYIDYNAYYQICQVQACFYTYNQRYSIIDMIILILCVIGGSSKILKYWIPIIVRCIRHKRTSSLPCSNLSEMFRYSINLKRVNKLIRLLNFFQSRDSHSVEDIRNEFWSTRIYILVFIPFFIILIKLYIPITSYSSIKISFPTLEKTLQLNESYSCYCSNDIMKFDTFMHIIPKFHSICSSDFVSDKWLESLERSENEEMIQLRIPFRLLSLFCQLAEQTFNNQLKGFYSNLLINTHLIPLKKFETRMNSSSEQMIVKTRLAFASSLKFVRDTMDMNGLLSASDILQDGADFIPPGKLNPGFIRRFKDRICYKDTKFTFNETLNITLTRFYTKCDGIEALLRSSLISLYNKTNVQFLSRFMNLSLGELDRTSHFAPNETIQSILNMLMLDTYTSNISYTNYFNKCQPRFCTSLQTTKHSLVKMIIIIIGLFAGLTCLLRFLVPIFIKFIQWPRKKKPEEPEINWKEKCYSILSYPYNQLRTFNLFRYSSKGIIHNEIISTRLFLFLFILFLGLLLFYLLHITIIYSEKIIQPTYEEFTELNHQYNNTLNCQCSKNKIFSFKTFLQSSPKFHQICSSDFIKDNWIKYTHIQLYDGHSLSYFNKDPGYFQLVGSKLFRAMKVLCEFSQQFVDERLYYFNTRQFFSNHLLTEMIFQEKINEITEEFIQINEQELTILLKLIQITTYGNQLISNFVTNWNSNNTQQSNSIIGFTDKYYPLNSCKCLTSSLCVQSLSLYTSLLLNNHTYPLNEMNIGCYILDALLSSSFYSFYQRPIISHLVYYIAIYNGNSMLSVPLLDLNQTSRYKQNTSVNLIFKHLMIEKWNFHILYQEFYQACNPDLCTYSYVARHDWTYIIIVLLGSASGLAVILRCIVPTMVTLKIKLVDKRRRRRVRIEAFDQPSSM